MDVLIVEKMAALEKKEDDEADQGPSKLFSNVLL